MEASALLRNLTRSRAKAWLGRDALKGLFTRNLPLKLVAIALAIVMWTFVAVQRRGETTELKFSTPLVFRNIPANAEIAQTPVQSVSVLVRAQRRMANALNPNQFQVVVDLGNQMPGQIDYELTARSVSYMNAPPPEGLTVLQISPARIPLKLEETLQKEFAIQPRFSGHPAPGFTIVQTKILPQMVQVVGTRKVMEQMRSIQTRPLDVQDLHSNVEMIASLDLPPGARLSGKQETRVRAQILVMGNPTRVLLRQIPVVFENADYAYKVSTTTLNVHLEGTREALAGLNRQNVFAVIDLARYPPGDYRGVVPRVMLPESVRVLEQWPILDLYVYEQKAK